MGIDKFHLLSIGLNHQSANVSLREKLAFSPHKLEASLACLGCGNGSCPKEIKELVILSTCNRVEIYSVLTADRFDILETFLAEIQDIPVQEFSSSIYRLKDKGVPSHLFDVAGGLDSVVIGEPQILGQVTDAYSVARRQGSAGKILSCLFQTAIHTGKRVRAETAIGHNPASVASVAVKFIAEVVADLQQTKIMVLGAGEMAELAVETLRKRGSQGIYVVNRSIQRAEKLAQRWGGKAAAFENLIELLPEMDIIITSTGAPHTIIYPSMVQRAIMNRTDRPMVFMDIAVPRDVDPQVGIIPGVTLFDMDTLSEQIENNLALRKDEVPFVQKIIAEELDAFMEYLATLDIIPLIVQMRKKANAIRKAEIRKNVHRIPNLSPEAHEQIEVLTKSIINKILHEPTMCLRREANGPDAVDYALITRKLFGLKGVQYSDE